MNVGKKLFGVLLGAGLLAGGAAALELDMESADSIVSKGGKIHGGGFADGAPIGSSVLNGNRAFLGGGAQDGIEFPISVLPLKEGSVSAYFKITDKIVPDQGFSIFAACGTPPWHNYFALGVVPHADGLTTLSFTLVGEKGKQDVVRSVVVKTALDRSVFHHVAVTWRNVNSGNADGEAALYLDGRLLKKRQNEVINVPNPGTRFFVGSTDLEHTRNKCGDGAFVLDEVVISEEVMDAAKIKELAGKLPKNDFADGRALPNMPVMGGGNRQFKGFEIPDFPVQQGAVFCRFRLEELIPGKSLVLWDNVGDPPWHDRIAMMLKMEDPEKKLLTLYFVTCGTQTGTYGSKVLSKKVPFDVTKSHTLLATWKNVNSGKSDAALEIFFDGTSVGTLQNFSLRISKPSDILLVGGSNPPAAGNVKKDLITVEECRVWRGEVPADQQSELLQPEAPETKVEGAFIALPQWQGAFAADGRIDPKFWAAAADFGPLHSFRDHGVVCTNTQFKAAYGNGNLYVAWKAIYPEAAPSGSAYGMRDAHLWNQDSVELHFAAPAGKIIIIVSAYGEIYDEVNGKSAWNSGIQVGTARAENKVWTGTAIVPLAEIAPDGKGLPLQGNLCRNVSGLQNQSSSWHRNFSAFGEWRAAGKTVVNDLQFPGNVSVGSNQIEVGTAAADQENHTLRLDVTVENAEKPARTRAQRTVSPRSAVHFPLIFTAPQEGAHAYTLTVRDEADNVLLQTQGNLQVLPPLAVKLDGAFYKNALNVKVDAAKMSPRPEKGSARILQNGQMRGKAQEFSLADGIGQAVLDTATLDKAGIYQVEVTVTDAAGKASSRVEDFEFAPRPSGYPENAGKKPYFGNYWFTPKFYNGVVKCWNRTYRWDHSLFPVSIVSGGEEMLAEAPYLEYRADGKVERLSAAKITVKEGDAEKARFAAVAESKALTVQAEIAVEYDGYIDYQWQITVKSGHKVDSLSLVIPMTREAAQYRQAGLETTFSIDRTRVAGYPETGKPFPFTQKIGLGNFEHALFLCTDSDQGWLPYDRNNVEVIVPAGDRVLWRWNVVDGAPVNLPKQHIGMQVTPYKPVSAHKTEMDYAHQVWPGGVFRPTDVPYKTDYFDRFKECGVKVLVLHMNWCKYTGGYEPDDPERLRAYVQKAHAMGFKVLLYLSNLVNPGEPSYLHYGDFWLAKPIGGWFGNPVQPKSKIVSNGRCPHAPGYIDWWVGNNAQLIKDYDVDGFYYDFGVGRCNNALHGCGYAGANTAVRTGESTETIGVNVGELTAEDKARRPTRPVFDQRELWKRMYNMVKELKGEEGIIDAHTSDPARVFSYPFVDTMYHSESAACHTGGSRQPEPLVMYRLYFTKEHLGTRGTMIFYSKKDARAESRAVLALSLPHRELYRPSTNKWEAPNNTYDALKVTQLWKLFREFDVEAAEWVPYWRNGEIVTVNGGDANTPVSAWVHPDRALLVLANVGMMAEADLAVTLQGKLAGFTKAVNAEDNTPVELQDNVLKCRVPQDDFRLILLSR